MPNLYPNRAARRAAQRSNRRRKIAGAVSVLGVGAAGFVISAPSAVAATYDVTTLAAAGAGSLAEAIDAANANAGPDTILFDATLTGTLVTPQLTITDAVTITGPGGTAVTLDGGGTNRILDITAEATTVSISGLRFSHGLAAATNVNTDGGGAIRSGADLTLTGTTFADNDAVQNGGAVLVSQGDLSISGSAFTGNSITGTPLEGGNAGGAVQLTGGNLTVADSAFTGNDARAEGGAISATRTTGRSTITDSTFTDNLVTVPDETNFVAAGGGAFLSGESFTISGSTFTGNAATGNASAGGGGVSVAARTTENVYGDVKILDSTFTGNSAASGGGALVTADTLEVDGTTFEDNSVTSVAGGGGLQIAQASTAVVSDSLFDGNTTEADSQGNGAGISGTGVDLEISGSQFTGNTSDHNGGAVYVNYSSTLSVDTSTFEGNTATLDGGAISGYIQDLAITNTTISGNTATGKGGGVYFAAYADPTAPAAPSATFQNVTLDGNQGADGAAIYGYLYAFDPASPQLAFSLDHVTITGSPAATNPIHLYEYGEGPAVFDVTISNTAIDAPLASLVIPANAAITFSSIGVDPQLGPLADNGGPTQTRLPQSGSPLINAGDPNYAAAPGAATTDQRGLARISGGRTDIGAVEVQVAPGVPVITVTGPNSVGAEVGETATFTASCTATEGAVVAYQWQVSTDGGLTFAPIAGATSGSYTTDPVTLAQDGTLYRVVCSAPGAESVTSPAAQLIVIVPAAPVVIVVTNPASQSVVAGQPASFTASCTVSKGGVVSYQWEQSVDGGATYSAIPNATQGTYTIASTTLGQSGNRYRAICSSPGATNVATAGASLTVTADPAIPVLTVVTNPTNQSVVTGQPATFTAACSATQGATVTYQWEVDSGGAYAAIPGATDATYTIPVATSAQNGNIYRAVCSAEGATSVATTGAQLTVNAAATTVITVVTSPTSQSVTAGQPASFSASCTATPDAVVTYQWQVAADGGDDFTAIPGATSATYTIAATTIEQSGNHYRVVCSAPGAVDATSFAAELTVTAAVPVITVTNPSSQSVTAGQPATFTANCSATEGAVVSYQWQLSTGGAFTDIPNATASTYVIAATTVSQSGSQYRVVCSAPGAETATSAAATLTVTAAPTTTPTTTPPTTTAAPTGTAAAPTPTALVTGTKAAANLASTGADTDRQLPFGLALLAAGAAMVAAGRTRRRSRHQ